MEKLKEIPQWVNDYNSKGHQSSAGKALKIVLDNSEKLRSMHAAMVDRVAIIKMDERLYYPSANINVNGPLAIIQISLGIELQTLERYLGLPISKLPLKK